VAIYHASFQVVKRSTGRSSVAAAAYRSGERLTDERTGEVHDYTRRSGVDHRYVMAPINSPDWAIDRSKLWSAVELGELNVALPRELSNSESRELLKEYVRDSFVKKGMVADVAMHDMNSENPHAHVMLTMRSIDQNGFGQKNRDWNSKDQLKEWREAWEQKVNHHLEVTGHDVRIDHRSLQDQGIDREPTKHMGAHASAMEKRGVQTELGDNNRRVERLNQLMDSAGAEIQKLKQEEQDEKQRQSNPPVIDPADLRASMREHIETNGSVLKKAAEAQRELMANKQAQKPEQEAEPERKPTRESTKRQEGPSH